MANIIKFGGGAGGSGNATATDILAGKTATVDSGEITGVIPSKTAQTYTPGTTNQVITSGQYLAGNQTIAGDSDLIAGNIKSGANIFGVAGSYVPTLYEQHGSVKNINNLSTIYITKDLGNARPCRIYTSCYNRYSLKIQGSTNNSTWVDLATLSPGENNIGELTEATSSYRYIRSVSTGVNNGGANLTYLSVVYI